MKKPKGHKASCACPFCKLARKGKAKRGAAKKSPAKKHGAKKHAAKKHATTKRHHSASPTFDQGFRDGEHDARNDKPMRRVRKDAYGDGYRRGVALVRAREKHRK